MRDKQSKNGVSESEIIRDIPLACSNEQAAVEFIVKQRWAGKPQCPHCDSDDVDKMVARKTDERNHRFLWRCKDCKKQYTVRIGTVLEDSRVPVRHWCIAFWLSGSSKKGCSAKQMQRMTGLSYKSALFLMHRIQFAMAPVNEIGGGKIDGTVKVDETYIGGKPRYRSSSNKRGTANKQPVVDMIERSGRVKARIVPNATS